MKKHHRRCSADQGVYAPSDRHGLAQGPAAHCARVLCLGMGLLLGASAWAQPSEDVLRALAQPFVQVNGQALSTAQAEVLFRERLAQGLPATPELKAAVRQELIDQALMGQAAHAEGLDRLPLVQAQMEAASRMALVRQWQQKWLADHPVSDDELAQAYQAYLATQGKEELLLRQVVVADEATARQLIQRLRRGEPFGELVRRHSIDAASRDAGGETGWVLQGRLLPDVARAVNPLQPRQLAMAPVRTAQGWHVLQLLDRRSWTPPTLAQLRDQLLDRLLAARLEQRLQALRNAADIR